MNKQWVGLCVGSTVNIKPTYYRLISSVINILHLIFILPKFQTISECKSIIFINFFLFN